MVLTPDEQAQLDALTAKAAEPAPDVPHKVLTVSADVLDTVRQLVQVHFAQIAGDVYSAFMQAVAEAEDVADPSASEPAAPAEPVAVPDEAPPEPFGTETHEV